MEKNIKIKIKKSFIFTILKFIECSLICFIWYVLGKIPLLIDSTIKVSSFIDYFLAGIMGLLIIIGIVMITGIIIFLLISLIQANVTLTNKIYKKLKGELNE